MSAIKTLCTSSIILHKGQNIFQGDVYDSLVKYMSLSTSLHNEGNRFFRESSPTDKSVYLKELEIYDDLSLNYFCLQLKC